LIVEIEFEGGCYSFVGYVQIDAFDYFWPCASEAHCFAFYLDTIVRGKILGSLGKQHLIIRGLGTYNDKWVGVQADLILVI